MRRLVLTLFITLFASIVSAQEPNKELRQFSEDTERNFEMAIKQTNDVLWYFKCGAVAQIDKVLYPSKPARTKHASGQVAVNLMILPAYVFTPKSLLGK